MGLTTYERHERIMERSKLLNKKYDIIRSIKSEVSSSIADELDALITLLDSKEYKKLTK